LRLDSIRIKVINAVEADVASVAAYITKPPQDAKNRHSNPKFSVFSS